MGAVTSALSPQRCHLRAVLGREQRPAALSVPGRTGNTRISLDMAFRSWQGTEEASSCSSMLTERLVPPLLFCTTVS